jgi:hypothetical protein
MDEHTLAILDKLAARFSKSRSEVARDAIWSFEAGNEPVEEKLTPSPSRRISATKRSSVRPKA